MEWAIISIDIESDVNQQLCVESQVGVSGMENGENSPVPLFALGVFHSTMKTVKCIFPYNNWIDGQIVSAGLLSISSLLSVVFVSEIEKNLE